MITVRWTTAEPSQGWVEFGESEGYGYETPQTELGTEHEVLLLGLPAAAEAHFRVCTSAADAQWSSEDQLVTTGELPHELPLFDVQGDMDGWVILPLGGAGSGPVIVDGQGRTVWYWLGESGAQLLSARVSIDGRSLLVAERHSDVSVGSIRRVPLAGGEPETIVVEGMGFDLVELEDGTLGYLRYDTREWEGQDATADAIVELAPDGTERMVWSFWDEFTPEDSCPGCQEYGDLSHANALDYDPETGQYLAMLLRMKGLFAIDRSSGERQWTLFGLADDFAHEEGIEPAIPMHQFQRAGDRLVIFENSEADFASGMVEYTLDLQGMTVERTWEYRPEPTLFTSALGDAAHLAGGGHQGGFGTAGVVQQLDADGELSWQLSTELGYGFGYTRHVDDLYPGR